MRGGRVEADDLPQLWQEPACDDLLACLKKLRLELPVWSLKTSRAEALGQQQAQQAATPREIITFLSHTIKSSLAWIEDGDAREKIWEEASKRLSERCGRTGETAQHRPAQ